MKINTEKAIQAGKIAKQAREYAKEIIKPGMKLLEIAEKIEAKIITLGAQPAFPVNLSINEIAAHYTPTHDDETVAKGLLKVDLGAHLDGWTADTAFTLDLENSEENKKLIQAAEKALQKALEITKKGTPLNEIGKTIQQTIESKGFLPIINLSGHSMEEHDLHSGITIPNFDNKSTQTLPEGLYAIEPFATLGNASGSVKDGPASGIYMLTDTKNVRSPLARDVLDHIIEEYETLPFCERWIVKKFGIGAKFSLRQLEQNENLHHFPQLVEQSGNKVSQAEHTILLDKEKIITTK